MHNNLPNHSNHIITFLFFQYYYCKVFYSTHTQALEIVFYYKKRLIYKFYFDKIFSIMKQNIKQG